MNVVFWVGVKNIDTTISEKHGNFEYFEYSKATWRHWCIKNNVMFFEYDTTTYKDKITWTRWFDLDSKLKNYDWNKVAVVDASYMIKWDAPNFFNLTNDNLSTFRSLENITWISEGIDGYQKLFPDVCFDLKRYIDCGFQVFTKSHLPFLNMLKDFYFDHLMEIQLLESTISRGTDQPIYNYLLQKNQIKYNFELPASFNLNHMNRFNWFAYNWQLNESNMPYFIKYGYLWKFSGFDRKQRNSLMLETWNLIKENYA